jgi:anti-anti-sigma regulatory factor
MTLRIERQRSGDTLIVQLIGEFDVDHLAEVKAQVNDAPCPVVVDIGELTLISVEGIRFLNACHDNGMPIVNASGYIAQWMTLEGRSEPKHQ